MKALVECLQGDAADILGTLERTGVNYAQAIELLKTRVGNPQMLSKAYFRELDQVASYTRQTPLSILTKKEIFQAKVIFE